MLLFNKHNMSINTHIAKEGETCSQRSARSPMHKKGLYRYRYNLWSYNLEDGSICEICRLR